MRLTQRRYYTDPEVRDRAPAEGESWIPPLGPLRPAGPLVVPTFDDAYDDAANRDDGPLTDEQERTHGTAGDVVDGGADVDDFDDITDGEGLDDSAVGVLGLTDTEEIEHAEDYALTER